MQDYISHMLSMDSIEIVSDGTENLTSMESDLALSGMSITEEKTNDKNADVISSLNSQIESLNQSLATMTRDLQVIFTLLARLKYKIKKDREIQPFRIKKGIPDFNTFH